MGRGGGSKFFSKGMGAGSFLARLNWDWGGGWWRGFPGLKLGGGAKTFFGPVRINVAPSLKG